MILLLVLFELFLIFLLSRSLTIKLFLFFWYVTGSHRWAISFTTILLFPGTVIHELSHLFVAEVLGVRTGKLTLVPEAIEESTEEIRSGSVAISKTDPLRRTLIGLAPVFVGIITLGAVSHFFFQNINNINIITIITFYIMFVVSNAMFSSPEDMKGVVPFLLTAALFGGAAYLAGLRIGLTGQALEAVTNVVQSLTQSLGLVLAVNLVLLLALKVLVVMIGGLKKRLPAG